MESNMLQHYPLLQECLEALNVSLLPTETSESISRLFKQIIPITKWGKVNWDAVEQKVFIGYDQNNIIDALERLLKKTVDEQVYIEWSTYEIPVIQAHLKSIIAHFDDVTCVAIEKFIFNVLFFYLPVPSPMSRKLRLLYRNR